MESWKKWLKKMEWFCRIRKLNGLNSMEWNGMVCPNMRKKMKNEIVEMGGANKCLALCLFTPPIPFYSIPFFSLFSIIQTIPFHSTFFNHFFQLSKSLYNIFKSQPFIPPRNSQSQTIFQTIFKLFRMVKNDQNGFPKRRSGFYP